MLNFPEWSVEYNARDFTAKFCEHIWHEIWRPFPGLKCVATAAEFTFYVNTKTGARYFTIERGKQ